MITISNGELNFIIECLKELLSDGEHDAVYEAELVKLIVGLEEKQDI